MVATNQLIVHVFRNRCMIACSEHRCMERFKRKSWPEKKRIKLKNLKKFRYKWGSLFEACVRYFWKKNVFLDFSKRSALKKKLNLQLFHLPIVSWTFILIFSLELTCAAPLFKTSCFEETTVCVIDKILARRSLSR